MASTTKALPTKADAVVIGGGSIGTAVHYHLAKMGYSTVLLEQNQLTSGTTWHSAGMLWRLRPNDTDIELNAYTRELLQQLEAETETAAWHENGGLFIAKDAERLAEYERLAEMGNVYSIESTVVAPEHIQDIHPLLATDDVVGALYSPTDGTIDPTGAVTAYSRGAKAAGGLVFENTEVAAIHTKPGRHGDVVTGLTTTCGHKIETDVVVNAAGAWANAVSEMVCAPLPLLALKHAFVLTESIEGVHKDLPNVRDHDLSIYLKTQGDSLAVGGYEQNPEFLARLDPEFSFGLYELDWDTFDQNFQGHLRRCPLLETTGIQSTICGPESFTPDHKPLCGPQPGVDGFFQACGFNSMGMMLGGGIGREVAHWIDTGSASVDMFSFDVARFHPTTVADPAWVQDRTHESYAKTYAVVFPHDEPLAGRNRMQSPLHETLVRKGCVYQSRHGGERPGWFADEAAPTALYDFYGAYADEGTGWRLGPGRDDVPAGSDGRYLQQIEGELTFQWPASSGKVREECLAARHGAAIFDQTSFGNFIVEGPEAEAAVQWVCGADIASKGVGDVSYTVLCNANGGVEADLTVAPIGPNRYYFVGGGQTVTKDYNWIRNAIAGYDCVIRNISDETAVVSIQGPHSKRILEQLVQPGALEMPFSSLREIDVAGTPVQCLRLTFVGELGYELHCPRQSVLHIYNSLWEVAGPYSAATSVPVRDAGYRAMDSLSAEKSFRHWHADLSNRDTPFEASIGFTVLGKLKTDVPFLGREALERHRTRGLGRRLVCLTVDDRSVMLHGAETLHRDGVCVGLVKSAAYGYHIGASIAHGYAERPASLDGRITMLKWISTGTWEIGDRGVRHPATYHARAPYDPKMERLEEAPEIGNDFSRARSTA